MTMASRSPRQLTAFDVGTSVSAELIQQMVDSVNHTRKYHTDGAPAYQGVDFLGVHNRNVINKSDTHIIEGTNAQLRHYIAGLRRKSRCFFRSLETLKAVLYIFINAYNKFGEWKKAYRVRRPNAGRDYHFSHINFI